MKFLFERKEWRRIRRDSSFLTFLRNYWTKKRTKFEWKIPLHHSCNNFAQFLLFSFLLRFFSYIFLFDWRSTKILFRNWIPPHRLLPTINNKHPITPLLYIFKTCLQTPSFKYHTKINIAFNIRVFLFPPRNSSPPPSSVRSWVSGKSDRGHDGAIAGQPDILGRCLPRVVARIFVIARN